MSGSRPVASAKADGSTTKKVKEEVIIPTDTHQQRALPRAGVAVARPYSIGGSAAGVSLHLNNWAALADFPPQVGKAPGMGKSDRMCTNLLLGHRSVRTLLCETVCHNIWLLCL